MGFVTMDCYTKTKGDLSIMRVLVGWRTRVGLLPMEESVGWRSWKRCDMEQAKQGLESITENRE